MSYKARIHEIFNLKQTALYSFTYLIEKQWASRATLERARKAGELAVIPGTPCMVKGEAFLNFIKFKTQMMTRQELAKRNRVFQPQQRRDHETRPIPTAQPGTAPG